MRNATISVIIPVYRAQAYLAQCVQSVCAQTCADLEIWLVDDGSPDDCPALCDAWAQKDPRIRVLHQPNQGQGAARNAALDRCTGAWVAFVDSDDWVEPQMYETMLAFAAEKDLDVVYCTARIEREHDDREIRFLEYPDRTVKPAREVMVRVLKDEIGGQPWKALYKRRCWETVRFPTGMKYEDLAMSWQPFLHAAGEVGFLAAPFYHYRMNPESTSWAHNPRKYGDIFRAFCLHYDYARAHCPEAADTCLAKCLSAALLAHNSALVSPQEVDPARVAQARQMLADHRRTYRAVQSLPARRKLLLGLYYRAPVLYRRIALWRARRSRTERTP